MQMGYRLAEDERVAAAQMLGARMARMAGEEPTDAAQDAVIAYLEATECGKWYTSAPRLKHRLLAERSDGSHRRPLLSRSYRECLEPLPEWAQ